MGISKYSQKMDACSVFSKDIIRDHNYSYLFQAQNHKSDLLAQLRQDVTSQFLSKWYPKRAASCLFGRQHLPAFWQILSPSWDAAAQPNPGGHPGQVADLSSDLQRSSLPWSYTSMPFSVMIIYLKIAIWHTLVITSVWNKIILKIKDKSYKWWGLW